MAKKALYDGQEEEEEQQEAMPHMAGGGVTPYGVDADGNQGEGDSTSGAAPMFDKDGLMDSLQGLYGKAKPVLQDTVKNAFSMIPGVGEMMGAAELMPENVAGDQGAVQAAQTAAPQALQTKAANTGRLPGMPDGVTPDDLKKLQNYLGTQKAQINKYSPDQEYATEQSIQKARTGLPMGLANAGAGLADAVMQGVARAGSSNFQKNLQEQGQQTEENAAGAIERARKGSTEQVEANQKIDMQDPASPLSRMAQKTYQAQLVAAGLPASAVPYMSASLIGDVASKQVTLAEALARINEEATYHKGMLEGNAAQRSVSAADTLAKMGVVGRAFAPKSAIQALTNATTGQSGTPSTTAPGSWKYVGPVKQ